MQPTGSRFAVGADNAAVRISELAALGAEGHSDMESWLSKQENVQQQNDLIEAGIRSSAIYWRSTGWPKALFHTAEERGIDCKRSIVVDLDIDFPGMPRLFGLLLTATRRFIRFEIDTDPSHDRIESIEAWEDVTDEQNLSQHNRGIGWGRGALALKVLAELNVHQ